MVIQTFDEARDAALKYLGYAARSEAEVSRRLRKDGTPEAIIEAVLSDFRNRGWVDDEVFARRWVEDRADRKLYGRARLARELHQRGVAKDFVDDALASDDDDSEIGRAEAALLGKMKNFDHNNNIEKKSPQEKKKLSDFLARRGFSYRIIAKVLKQNLKNEE